MTLGRLVWSSPGWKRRNYHSREVISHPTFSPATISVTASMPGWRFEIPQLRAAQEMSVPPCRGTKNRLIPSFPALISQPLPVGSLSRGAHSPLCSALKTEQAGAVYSYLFLFIPIMYSCSSPWRHRCCSGLSLTVYAVHLVWGKVGSVLRALLTTKTNATKMYSLQIPSILQIPVALKPEY